MWRRGVQVVIDKKFPLSDAAGAHEYIEGRGLRAVLLIREVAVWARHARTITLPSLRAMTCLRVDGFDPPAVIDREVSVPRRRELDVE